MGAHISMPDRIQSSSHSPFARLSKAYAFNEAEHSSKEKRKRSLSKLATLRKKLVRSRHQSKSLDHAKLMKEMLSAWPLEHVKILVQEYEVTCALKELTSVTSQARPSASTLRDDLTHLYDCSFCSDVNLIYKNSSFPVHRAILSARSPYFKQLLSHYPEYGARVHVKLKTSGIDVTVFSAVLRYLYSDHLAGDSLKNMELLSQLAGELGVPNDLEHDMKQLLDTGELIDAILVFSGDSDLGENSNSSYRHTHEYSQCMTQSVPSHSRTSRLEFPCHKAIIASRSPFFRNLINRRTKSGEELASRTLRSPSRIVLDESVIPQRYARVLLNALYQDTVDMGCVLKGSSSLCSLSEIQAMVSTGRCQMTIIDEAMELYQIGQFLDTHIISQGCEDIIIDNLTSESLVRVLNWSAEPHGSKWVHRQALAFLTEEFSQIANSPVLYELSQEYLMEVLSSDYLQASEQDVLSCVVRWGEHQLIKRIEEREPNLLCHTAHSITRKGVKRRDLSDLELADLLSDILPLVRTEHVLPSTSDVLGGAIKRGLVEPPMSLSHSQMLMYTIGAWTGISWPSGFRRPRLFLPYFEEAKCVLNEAMSQDHDPCDKIRTIHLSAIPDTLYMLEERSTSPSYSPSSPMATVDVIAGSIPVPDRTVFVKMLEREQELLQSRLVQKVTSLVCLDKRALNKCIEVNMHLRVVREFGLPDSAIEILQNRQYYYSSSICRCRQPHHTSCTHSLQRHQRHQRQQFHALRRSSDGSLSPVAPFGDVERQENTLSDVMPDIAMAATPLSQIHQYTADLNIGSGSTCGHDSMYI